MQKEMSDKRQATSDNTKPQLHSPEYTYAGKETLGEIIGRVIPKQFTPTKRLPTIFGSIFLLVAIIALFQFPYGSLMSGNTDITIKIGYPLILLEIKMSGNGSTVYIKNLILDLLLYMVIAYLIDITITLIFHNKLTESKEEKKKYPKIFKNKKESLSDQITKKVFEKENKQPPKPKQSQHSDQPSS